MCRYTECSNLALLNKYCPKHKCEKCDSLCVTSSKRFCYKHNSYDCDCSSIYFYTYCKKHKCKYEKCINCQKNYSYYCSFHRCSYDKCNEIICKPNKRYCKKHKCKVMYCDKVTPNEGCCDEHKCKIPDCTSSRYDLGKLNMCDYHFQLS